MAEEMYRLNKKCVIYLLLSFFTAKCSANDILGCGGFIKSHVNLDYAKIEVGLYTKEGSLKERTECAPTNGYYFIPVYEKGEYILKVHPPAGWSFEPSKVDLNIDGVSDACSMGHDINFTFNGFGITGRVITAGQTAGPSGVSVQLISDKGETRNTVTAAGGDFHFTPVIPGKYKLKASHPRVKLDPSSAEVVVSSGNTVLPAGALAVRGYELRGSVTFFGNPIQGIYVLLYSKKDNLKYRVEGCQTALLQGVPDAPTCHSVTDASGHFSFGLVPAGEYYLMPLSTSPGQHKVIHNIKPDKLDITVQHDSLYIKNAFEVGGVTVSGSVLSSSGGGISGVQVSLDGRPVARSGEGGQFSLASLKPGEYLLTFRHEECKIPDVKWSISREGVVSSPVARVSGWRVCGRATSATAATGQAATATEARLVAASAKHTERIPLDEQGEWCAFLPSGDYVLTVDAPHNEAERWSGVSGSVSVKEASVGGVEVRGVRGALRGRAPGGSTVSWRQGGRGARGGEVTLRPDEEEYTFSEVPPGKIEVSIIGDAWCWEQSRHVVTVTRGPAAVPDFRRSGRHVAVHSSHQTQVEYSCRGAPPGRSRWSVAAGSSRLCLPLAECELRPVGCHKFREETVTVDATKEVVQPINFVAISHETTIMVESPVPVTDLQLRLSGDQGGATVGPLAGTSTPSGFQYKHTMYMAEGEITTVSGISSLVVFSPNAPVQIVGRGECVLGALLTAREGAVRRGGIVPEVEGVTVTLTTDEFTLTQTTTVDGTYSFGPIDASLQYSISAQKESYVFTGPDDKGDFKADKLADIHVYLVDENDDTPLQGALVSISGGQYRARGLASSGRWSATGLLPHQYYIKPHMQEYKFSPPSTIIHVDKPTAYNVTIKGGRVAWSCSGSVLSVGGAAFRAVTVSALPVTVTVSADSSGVLCAALDAQTDDNGEFRIRGLLPECQYTLQLKESADFPGLKLVKAPTLIQVKDKKDITGVTIIGHQWSSLTDVEVTVYCPNFEQYASVRVSVTSQADGHGVYTSRVTSPVTSHVASRVGALLALPRLASDNATYELRLESSLSKATHVYQEQVVYFNADGKFKHFHFEFAPKLKSSEQEFRQGGWFLLALLCMPLLLFSRQRLMALLAAITARDRHTDRKRQRVVYIPRVQVSHQSLLLDELVPSLTSDY